MRALLALLALPGCVGAQTVSVTRLLHRTPSKAWASFNRGAELYEAGALESGGAELERAVALDPGFAEAHCNLGVIYMVMNRTEDAAREFRRAEELDPSVAAYHCDLGVALAALGRVEEGEAEARAAIARDAACVKAQFLLGLILASRPETRAEAQRRLEYAGRKMPEARAALERLHQAEGEARSGEP